MLHLDNNLAELKNLLLTMASHAEAATRRALEALVNRDYDLAQRVRAEDSVIDRLEVEVDDQAITLLSKAPLASDLRLIAAAMKMSQNLERVGDEACKIANRARDLTTEPPLKLFVPIPQLADLALGMLKQAIDSFVSHDTATARALIPQDKEVDAMNKDIHRQLVEYMTAHPDTISRCLHWMVVAKALERIADHAKNVAEEVVYLCEAEDIRHAGAGSA
ncbi:MAG TPA: phosphate signaling complex protein PhoU [Verrucomicrobiae bacterium]|nr:phosphate signaling complex protein PhoU [Verrucomicrobiae bacterium]